MDYSNSFTTSSSSLSTGPSLNLSRIQTCGTRAMLCSIFRIANFETDPWIALSFPTKQIASLCYYACRKLNCLDMAYSVLTYLNIKINGNSEIIHL